MITRRTLLKGMGAAAVVAAVPTQLFRGDKLLPQVMSKGATVVVYAGEKPKIPPRFPPHKTLVVLRGLEFVARKDEYGQPMLVLANPVRAEIIETGIAGWFRLTSPNGLYFFDGTVGWSNCDLNMCVASNTFLAGTTFTIDHFHLQAG